MDWIHVYYLWIIMMFLSAVWTFILTAPIHCRWSISEQVICSDEETNLITSWIAWKWVNDQQIVIFS